MVSAVAPFRLSVFVTTTTTVLPSESAFLGPQVFLTWTVVGMDFIVAVARGCKKWSLL